MNNLVRANRISVQAIDGVVVAKFWRTHKLVGQTSVMESVVDGFVVDATMNATAQREMYRAWLMGNSNKYGIEFDVADGRATENQFPSKYTSDAMVIEWAQKLITSDIQEWVAKMGTEYKQEIQLIEMGTEDIIETLITPSGKAVNAKYGNGNWAYCTIPVTCTFETKGVQGYVTMSVNMVSGQMKKPGNIGDLGYTFTGLKTELLKDIKESLPTIEKVVTPKKPSKKSMTKAIEKTSESITTEEGADAILSIIEG